jgi:SAM-dependent methyltransferase
VPPELWVGALPFDDDSFEVAVAGELLEHYIKPDWVVNEVCRVLIRGGIFIASVPNSFHWRARLAFVRGYSLEDPGHLHLFSLPEARKLLRTFERNELLPTGGLGGHVLPIVPPRVSRPVVHQLPTLFANDFLFRYTKR